MLPVTRFCASLACVGFLLTGAAQAQNSAEQYHSAVAKSNSAYKLTVNYLRTGNIDFALLELGMSDDNWQKLRTRYQLDAPAPYKNDPQWRDDLSEIGSRLSNGRAFILMDEIEKANRSLQPIRTLLHQLRQRNGVTLFEDIFFGASNHMRNMWQYRRVKVALANDYSRRQLSAAASAFHAAILASDNLASEALKKDVIYRRLMTTAKSSTPIMIAAISDRNYPLFLRYLRELRAIEQMIYLHFG